MSAPASKRIAWIDIAKGLAMLAVMADHCGIGLAPIVDYFEVPAFFILSGLMMKRLGDYGHFALGKARRLLEPYLIYNALFAAFFFAYGWFSAGLLDGIKQTAWAMIVSVNYPLWFLKALLWGMLIAGGCIRLGMLDKPGRRIACLALLALAGIAAGSVECGRFANASCLPQGVIASSLLAAGYCIKAPVAEAMKRLNGWMALALAAALMAIGWLAISGNIGFYRSDIGCPWLFYPFTAISFAAGAMLSKAMACCGEPNPIEYIGRHSMRYFCLHAFAIKAAQLAGLHSPWLVFALTVASVSIANALIEKGKARLRAS